MTIEERVTTDMKTAMRNKEADALRALRNIRAAFLSKRKENNADTISDDDAVAILRKLAKQLAESIEAYDQGGRTDLAADERAELAVIERYLPQLASEETVAAWVDEAIASTGATAMSDMGKVMGALMRTHKGEMDAGLANQLVKARLGA